MCSEIALDMHRFQSTSKSSPSGYAYFDTAFATDYEVLYIDIRDGLLL
jgi:hypothetical protein